MKRLSILLFLFLFCGILNLFSQRIDNVWPMGYDCCQSVGYGAVDLFFNQGVISTSLIQRHQNINETVGSVCDSLNNILFTSNGIYISNSLDDTMQNGNNLNPSYFTNQHLQYGLTIPQANLILPSLTNSNEYVLFHNTIDDYLNTGASFFLYTSVIDLSQNGGLGSVVNKNSILYTDSMTPGRIAACRHANGRDWWIVVHRLRSKDVVEFLYTPQGVSNGARKSLIINREFYAGQCIFNPQGTRYVFFEKDLGLEIGDFDRCTGNISNVKNSLLPDTNVLGAGAAFSPNGRFLYVSSTDRMYQYDTWSNNLDSSRILIGVYDGFQDPVSLNVTHFWLEALAPDGKIYVSTTNSTPYLHVINYPDSLGLACNFCQHCITLPVAIAFTMPNFPNYLLGADVGSVCDSLTSSINDLKNLTQDIILFPNPAINLITVKSSTTKIESITIYNALSQIVEAKIEKQKSDQLQLNIEQLVAGFYYMEVITERGKAVKKFVKQ